MKRIAFIFIILFIASASGYSQPKPTTPVPPVAPATQQKVALPKAYSTVDEAQMLLAGKWILMFQGEWEKLVLYLIFTDKNKIFMSCTESSQDPRLIMATYVLKITDSILDLDISIPKIYLPESQEAESFNMAMDFIDRNTLVVLKVLKSTELTDERFQRLAAYDGFVFVRETK